MVVVVVVVVVVGSWEAGVERRQMGTILEKMFVQSSHQSYKSKGLKLNSTQLNSKAEQEINDTHLDLVRLQVRRDVRD